MFKPTLYLASVICFMLTGQHVALANEQVSIPAGTFKMGCSHNDPDCEKDEGPQGGTPP